MTHVGRGHLIARTDIGGQWRGDPAQVRREAPSAAADPAPVPVAEALRELAGDPGDPSHVIVSRAYLLKLAAQLDA
ncbi:hypothetical protein [Micromonospora okii]|uniref:hypothetical protein n=1 Tax=Micromonospora okii TaxID=1182970 RepID=UPI001E37C13F|nr:hypothetical protein [Micromonospora okii]